MSRNTKNFRQLRVESLENRRLLATDYLIAETYFGSDSTSRPQVDNGDIYFLQNNAIVKDSDATTETIVDASTLVGLRTVSAIGNFSVDSNQVVFSASLNDGSSGLYQHNSGIASTVVESGLTPIPDDPFSNFGVVGQESDITGNTVSFVSGGFTHPANGARIGQAVAVSDNGQLSIAHEFTDGLTELPGFPTIGETYSPQASLINDQVVFVAAHSNDTAIFRQNIDGTGSPSLIAHSSAIGPIHPVTTSDGTTVVFRTDDAIYTYDNTLVEVFNSTTQIDGRQLNSIQDISIDQDTIVFTAIDSNSQFGLYAIEDGNDPMTVYHSSNNLRGTIAPQAINLSRDAIEDGTIAFHAFFGGNTQGVYTATPELIDPPEPAVLGIDKWWATIGSGPMNVSWTINIAEEQEYIFDVTIEGANTWDLTTPATVTVNDGPPIVLSEITGSANVGTLSPGQYTFEVSSFVVPTTAIVEPVFFTLSADTGQGLVPTNELEALFIADFPEAATEALFPMNVQDAGNNLSIQDLIEEFAPTLHFAPGEIYHQPVNLDDLFITAGRSPENPWGDNPRGDANDYIGLSQFANSRLINGSPATVYASILPCQFQHEQESGCDRGNEFALTYTYYFERSDWERYGGANTHEGDIESIVIFFNRDSSATSWEPDEVAYSQHTVVDGILPETFPGGQMVAWRDVSRDGNNPNVYIGLGGHASYPVPGTSWINSPTLNNFDRELLEQHNSSDMLSTLGNVLYQRRVDEFSSSVATYTGFIGNSDLEGNGSFPLSNISDMAPRNSVFQQLVTNATRVELAFGFRHLNPWHWSRNFNRISLFDRDGVIDQIENAGPNSGDGNSDGVLDSLQSNVAAFRNAATGDYVTIETQAGELANVIALPVDTVIANTAFPVGKFQFDVTGITPGASIDVNLFFAEAVNLNAFFKQISDTFAPFAFDGETGARVVEDHVVITLVDGGRGDADGVANGVIVDPFVPALELTTSRVRARITRAGKLVITGDNKDNAISIEQLALRQYSVTGLHGTLINGQASIVVNARSGVLVNTKGGNDTISFTNGQSNIHHTRVNIRTGSGDDTVSIFDTTGRGFLLVSTSRGNDIVSLIDVVFQGRTRINLGPNDDELLLKNTRLRGNTFLNGGPGSNLLTLIASDIANARPRRFQQIVD